MVTQHPHESLPPVWVRVGALDSASVREARRALSEPVVREASAVVVDLAGLDDRHELTGFALIVELHRHVTRNGGAVSAVNPPARLAANLMACDVPVTRDARAVPLGAVVVEVGRRPSASPGAPAVGGRTP
jgi:anti-anti-sigma regulatory factor